MKSGFDLKYLATATLPIIVLTPVAPAQPVQSNSIPVKNWSLPAAAVTASSIPAVSGGSVAAPLVFISITPCRVLDTRAQGGSGLLGAFGPPSLIAGQPRTIPIPASTCGVPVAAAYSLNFVSITPAGQPQGYVAAWPDNTTWPGTVVLNALQGGVVDNAAVVPAGPDGGIQVVSTNNGDLVIDMNGYYILATTIQGLAGPQGPPGNPGMNGPSGSPGPAGATGAAGTAGVTGAAGTAGPAGAVGTAGATGAVGTAGATGATGIAGATGTAGIAGPSGPAGAGGTPGSAGPVGATGPSGPQGLPGPPGVDVPFAIPITVTAHTTNDPTWGLTTGAQAAAFGTSHLAVAPVACTPTMTVHPSIGGSATFTVYHAVLPAGFTGPPTQGRPVMSCTSSDGASPCTATANAPVDALSMMYLIPSGGSGSALVAFSCR